MAKVKRKPQAKTHELKTMPPPIGGINARDGIGIMPQEDAVDLVNWIPDTFGVRCRKGYKEWAINFPEGELVSSIMDYIPPNALIPAGSYLSSPTEVAGNLFGASDQEIYDISTSTDAPASVFTLSGANNAGVFSHAVVSNVAGTFLCACSETDGYHVFNGTTWTKPTAGAGAGQIDGASPANFCFNMLWKRRMWFVERDSTRVWYLPTDQITGAVTEFDFGSQFKNGGHLAFLANWTIDAGEGIDDLLVAVSSNGDVALYKGTDPDSATTFQLVGTFFIGQVPIGRRGWAQYGGDLILLSSNGIYPLSFVTRGGAGLLQASGEEYSSKIRSPLGRDIQNSFTAIGWGMLLHPSERIFMIGVPDHGGQRARQYVMATTQNKWTRFTGIPIRCFGKSLNYAFAGTTDGRVVILFTSYFDEVAYGENTGFGIRGTIYPAFSFFGTPALEKQFLMVRPMFLSVDRPAYSVSMRVNFDTAPPRYASSESPVSFDRAQWDSAVWGQAQWSGRMSSFAKWDSVGGVGFSGAVGLTTECVGETLLAAIDYMVTAGGPM